MSQDYIRTMAAHGVPPAFSIFAIKHLNRVGYNYLEFDLTQYYHRSLSLRDNMSKFASNFPVSLFRPKHYEMFDQSKRVSIFDWKGKSNYGR